MRCKNLQDVIVGAFKDKPSSLVPSLSPTTLSHHIIYLTIGFAASRLIIGPTGRPSILASEKCGLEQDPEAVLREVWGA